MNSKINRLVIFSLLTLLLSGCQQINEKKANYVKNHSRDYLKSSLIQPLQIPAGLSQPVLSETFPLPADLPPPGSVAPVSLVPPGFGKLS